MIKVYTVETRKQSYTVLGTSKKDVLEFVNSNRHKFTFDTSGYFKVALDKNIFKIHYSYAKYGNDGLSFLDSAIVKYNFGEIAADFTEKVEEIKETEYNK